MPSEVDLATFLARREGAVVLDVREPDEFASGHVPGARNVPLDQVLISGVGGAPTGPVYLLCQSGNRSRFAADALAATGVSAVSVVGGTAAWASAGHPLVSGRD